MKNIVDRRLPKTVIKITKKYYSSDQQPKRKRRPPIKKGGYDPRAEAKTPKKSDGGPPNDGVIPKDHYYKRNGKWCIKAQPLPKKVKVD